jgi:two-component system, chemotaxis family, protein-glutamate methylesterase/glutaminase
MRRTRVLIVDDSVVIRRSLTETLTRTPEILVVGSASSGRIALMKIPLLCPDVVALDMEMPDASGVETLSAIRAAHPSLSVIVLGSPAGAGHARFAQAVVLGAVASVIKPASGSCTGAARQLLGDDLAAKIMKCCPAQPCFTAIEPEQPHDAPAPPEGDRTETRVDVLAIAVSTGGPSALMDLIPRFPKDFPVPIVIVQHMPPIFTTLLAERLAAKSSIRVVEGSLHQMLAPGCASIAPGDFHMAVVRDGAVVRLHVDQEPPENSCRPAADVLFRSVARVYGRHVLAIVMTGMGQDGFIGCERIRAAGGQIIVQDEESSVVWGMPGFVVKAGLADQVLPLSALGPEIIRKVWNRRRRAVAPAVTPGPRALQAVEAGRR